MPRGDRHHRRRKGRRSAAGAHAGSGHPVTHFIGRRDLEAATIAALREKGFEVELSAAARAQLAELERTGPAVAGEGDVRDLRALPWSSIDNRESRDLDQIEVAEAGPGGDILVRVGVADVDALVPKESPIDVHAGTNTTSVYAGGAVYPMLPEALSTGLTLLNPGEDRLGLVAEFMVCEDGSCHSARLYRAMVHNRAQLDYGSLGAWLLGQGPLPAAAAALAGLDQQLRLQDEAAQRLRAQRESRGALELETIEARPILDDGHVIDLEVRPKTRASELIEDFMIAANTAIAEFLEAHDVSWIRRMVRKPRRWARIVELAAGHGGHLPAEPDREALAAFLRAQRRADPLRFPDLSLAVVKLLGRGEYVLERRGEDLEGHFGLAVEDYTHSTAPNRRYADLLTQRLVKAVLAGGPMPYTDLELRTLAERCTAMEDAAQRVERLARKIAAAHLMAEHVGEWFPAIVTGASPKGTWVRLLQPPVEGRVIRGERGLDVGDRVDVQLLEVDEHRGYVDFGARR